MSTKHEREKEATGMFINSVMPSVLADKVIGDMTRAAETSHNYSKQHNLRQVITFGNITRL